MGGGAAPREGAAGGQDEDRQRARLQGHRDRYRAHRRLKDEDADGRESPQKREIEVQLNT